MRRMLLTIISFAAANPAALADNPRVPDLTIVNDAEQARAIERERNDSYSRHGLHSGNVAPAGKPPRESLEMLRQGNQRFVETR